MTNQEKLVEACEKGNIKAIKLLLEKNVEDINV